MKQHGGHVVRRVIQKRSQLYKKNYVWNNSQCHHLLPLSWNSTWKVGRIGRQLAEQPDVKVTMCFGPMPPDASDFPGGIPALGYVCSAFSFTLTKSTLQNLQEPHWKQRDLLTSRLHVYCFSIPETVHLDCAHDYNRQ